MKEAGVYYGPWRVNPGFLSVRIKSWLQVSKVFGDVEAKREALGGKSGVVVSTPDVKVIELN